ncbi:MAG: hypothetical protein AB8I08_12685 [Sandaracinaceae bacterium]
MEGLEANVDVEAPAALSNTLREASRRVRRSPLYVRGRLHSVYFCQQPWRWRLFARWSHNAGATALAPAFRSVFVRPSHLDRHEMVGPSGEVTAPGVPRP